MASPVTDRLANDVIRHKTGALNALIAHARALEEAQNNANQNSTTDPKDV